MNAPIKTDVLAANAPKFNERGLLDANIPPEAEIQAGSSTCLKVNRP